jgi:hypothetical protein
MKLIGIKNRDLHIDDSVNSQMMIFMLGVCSQMERESVSYRTKSGLAEAKRKAERITEETGEFKGICGSVRKVRTVDEDGQETFIHVKRKGTEYKNHKLDKYKDIILKGMEDGKHMYEIQNDIHKLKATISLPTLGKFMKKFPEKFFIWKARDKFEVSEPLRRDIIPLLEKPLNIVEICVEWGYNKFRIDKILATLPNDTVKRWKLALLERELREKDMSKDILSRNVEFNLED